MDYISHLEAFQWAPFSDEPLTEVGEGQCVSWDSLKTASDASKRDVAIFPHTTWGDYVGSTMERGNFNALKEHFAVTHEGETEDTYPLWLFEVLGGMGSRALAINLPALDACPDHEWAEVEDIVQSLADYPVFDEEAISSIESDLEWEDWEDWGKDDFSRELGDVFADELEELEEQHGADIDDCDSLKLADLFYDLCQESECYWEAETAVGGYWRFADIVGACSSVKFCDWFRRQFDADYRAKMSMIDKTAQLFAA